MAERSILLVEDNGIIAMSLQRTLHRLGYRLLSSVATGEEAIQAALVQRPEVILMDIKLAGAVDGIKAAQQIQAKIKTRIIYLTGNSQDGRLQQKGVTCLSKPVDEWALKAAIENEAGTDEGDIEKPSGVIH